MCRQGIRRRLRQETRGSEGNLCPLTTQLRKYSPVRLRGGYFFTLSYPSVVQIFYWLPIIWITHLNYPVQLDYANTSPFRYRGGYFFILSYPSVVQIFYWLPIIWITHLHYPVQLDYANTHPFRYRGILYTFFSFRRSTLYNFFTSIIWRLFMVSDHINCPKQFSSVNTLPYRV